MSIHVSAWFFEAGVSIQGAYLHASREGTAGRRHENTPGFEWIVKINMSTLTCLFSIPPITSHVVHVTS